MAIDQIAAQFPRTISLGEDGKKAEIRFMTAADRDAVLAFAQSLPEEDLLFLRADITDPAVIDGWVAALDTGESTSLLAFDGEAVAGYASVHRNPARWTRGVGEIRVNVGSEYRSRGLGRNLISEIFDVAQALDLRKLMANMTTDQRGAQQAFKRLGFVAEALLTDFVEDRNGNPRDLVIMSYEVDGLSETAATPLRV